MPSWRHSHASHRHSRRRSASQPASIDGHPIIDTQTADPEVFRSVAIPSDGLFATYHVTDNPSGLISALDSGKDLVEMNPEGDLGGGFYGSSVPEMWKSRSSKKWDYLKTLTRAQRQTIYDAIYSEPRFKSESHYLSPTERGFMERCLQAWLEEGHPNDMIQVANQPYAVRIDPDLLARMDIHPYEPGVVEIRFRGKFADLTAHPPGYVPIDEWRDKVDGVFTRNHAGTYPQIVIWNRDAIVDYREDKL